MAPVTLNGARCVVKVGNAEVGLFNNVSYNVAINIVPVETLGSLLPRELVQTSQDAVQITMSGYRALNSGPYANTLCPTVAELLQYDGVTLMILDRLGATTKAAITKPIMTIVGAKCTGFRTTHAGKATSDLEVTYIGIVATDETAADNDMKDATASTYPSTAPVAG